MGGRGGGGAWGGWEGGEGEAQEEEGQEEILITWLIGFYQWQTKLSFTWRRLIPSDIVSDNIVLMYLAKSKYMYI